MAKKKITERSIKGLQKSEEIWDTEQQGFYARKRTKDITFYFSYPSPETGKKRHFTIGKYGNLTVADAREAAKLKAADVAKGIDPQQEKSVQRVIIKKDKEKTLRNFLYGLYTEVTPKKQADATYAPINNHFSQWLDIPMDQIDPTEFKKWQNQYPGAASGANRLRDYLYGVLSKAIELGVIDKHPLQSVKKLRQDKKRKVTALTHTEETRLLTALEDREEENREKRKRFIEWNKERGKEAPEPHGAFTDHLKPIILLVLNTGLRQGEVFNLRLSDLHLHEKKPYLTVVGIDKKTGRRSKSEQSRHIPLNPKIHSVLTTWIKQTKTNGYIFPGENGERLDNIKTSITGIMKRASIEGKRLHALRHTFGSRLVQKRTDLMTIKELMGHASIETTERYLHTDNELMQRAVDTL